MLLEVEDLWVHYDGAEAVREVSFGIEEGTIVTFLGANGAGKTTTLRAISGLKRPTSGRIRFQGRRIDKELPQDIVKLGIAHCPEGRRLFPYLSVMDNLKTGAYLRKDKLQVKQDFESIYESFPVLRKRSNQKAGTLSGGEQQMLAIARALMSSPKLLLLDEPSMGLSPLVVKEISRLIKDIHNSGVTVVLVEQNVHMALRLAQYVYVLETGMIKLQGSTDEVLCDEGVKRAYLGGGAL